jgi:hypothetical protein
MSMDTNFEVRWDFRTINGAQERIFERVIGKCYGRERR